MLARLQRYGLDAFILALLAAVAAYGQALRQKLRKPIRSRR